MQTESVEIIEFDNAKHRSQVVELWQDVFGYGAPHNLPDLVIDKKLAAGDALFFVALNGPPVVGTVMAGYDGHRGWIYSLAVVPEYRHKGIGSALIAHAEKKLSSLGCRKVNLQIMDGNEPVERFYNTNGYLTERRISMGKLLNE